MNAAALKERLESLSREASEETTALVGLAILEHAEMFRGFLKELECTRCVLQGIDGSLRNLADQHGAR